MSHDPMPSSAAGRLPTQDDAQDAGADSEEAGRRHSSRRRGSSGSRAQAHKAGLAKKLQFTTDLMSSLDMVVFAELCALYYMDCSFFRLLIRSTAQSFFLSPKSEDFLVLMPAHRPHVFAIFLPNLLCVLLHLFWPLPQGSEATRGYLHGGVIIDFIGQKAPTSRLGLILLDLAVLAVQCFMLAVHTERERLRKIVMPLRRASPSGANEEGGTGGGVAGGTTGPDAAAQAPAVTGQDYDAEERGVLRDGPSNMDETADIEMQQLLSNRRSEGGAEGANGSTDTGHPSNLQDLLSSGNAVLAEFHVVHAIRTAGNDYQSAAAHSLQTIGYAATLARLAAERRARLEAAGQRQQ